MFSDYVNNDNDIIRCNGGKIEMIILLMLIITNILINNNGNGNK